MAGLFGPSVQEVQQAAQIRRLQQAQMLGSLGPAGHGALAGLNLASGIGGLFGAGGDPALGQARAMSGIQQELAQSGLRPGTPQYTQALTTRVRMRLGEQAAIQAWQQATQLEKQRLDIQQLRAQLAPPDQTAAINRMRALRAMGITGPIAQQAATDPKEFRALMDDLRESRKPSAKEKSLRALLENPELMAAEMRLRRSGATTVNVNQGDKPAAKADRDLVTFADGSPIPPNTTPNQIVEGVTSGAMRQMSQAESDALKQRTKDEEKLKLAGSEALNAAEQAKVAALQLNALSVTPGAAGFTKEGRAFQNSVNRLAKAIAQLRSPPGVEASQAMEQAIRESLGSGLQAATNPEAFIQMVDSMIAEAQQRTGQRQRLRYNPQTGRLE